MPPEVLVFNNMSDHSTAQPYILNPQHPYHLQPVQQQQPQQLLHQQTIPNGDFQSPSFQVNQFYAEQNLFQQMQMQKMQLAQEQAKLEQQQQQQQRRVLRTKKVKPVSMTPKKKRGRPPKPDSFTQRITSTMNINVNTSPLSSSPAESNSNSAAKQGAPNVFTPLMRVSPTTKTKRKRKNSTTSTISNQSPGMLKKVKSFSLPSTMLATPLSSVGTSFPNSIESQYHFNKNTLDNISMITQLQSKPSRSQSLYNTPPSSAGQKNGCFMPHHRNLDAMASQERVDASPIRKKSPDKNLLPPALLTGNTPKVESKTSDDFQLKLVIDDLGKAILSSDMFKPTQATPKPQLARPIEPTEEKPSRGVLRRCNSDITGSITQPKLESQLSSVNENFMTNPQTPKDNYMYVSTGLTPIFNLTPQFNSLMNSVMSLNSPQYRKGMNPFLVNQEIFTSEQNLQAPHQIPITLSHIHHLENLTEHPSEEKEQTAVDAEVDSEEININSGASSDESGDARLALKRVMYVQRD